MSRQRRSASATDRAGRNLRAEVRDALLEAGAERLRKLAKVIGNDALAGKVAQNDKLRDELLGFIQARLEAIQLAQQAEKKAMRERKLWFRRLARGEKGLSLPEPTRWAAPALLYKKAGEAICGGDLGRGADLLKQATEADRATFKAAPKQLGLNAMQRKGASDPGELHAVTAGEGCTPTTAPELERLADRIANVSDTMDPVALDRRYRPHDWWEQVDDEGEEKKRKEDPRRSKRMREPAAERDATGRGEHVGPAVETGVARSVKVGVQGAERRLEAVGVEAPGQEEPTPAKRSPKRRPGGTPPA
jgi:hypothetical protein